VYESPSASDNEMLAERVVELLRGGRSGLVTDVDGTISPIVERPESARVLPRAREALACLRDEIALVAVVSGRTAADAREMVDVEGVVYVGNHGLEVWADGQPELTPEARPWAARLAGVLRDLEHELPLEGVLVENKGATGSLHYRMAPDREAARGALLRFLARRAVTSGLRIEEGRMVLNLLPPLTVSKGSAVTWLVRRYALERVVYLGDDVTDAHAFRALGVLQQTAGLQTIGIGVVGLETPLSVRQLADATVPTVEAAADLLCEVATRLSMNE
jgi:trehalose 6-phosphate phosphatase